MSVTVLGDFADPLSFLASQRVEQLSSLGAADIGWLAVEVDRRHPLGGRPLDRATAAHVARLALPGECVPGPGATAPNSRAATAAYAESISDGRADAMRRALFDATWVAGLHVDDPNVIRSVVFTVFHPGLEVDVPAGIGANRMVVPLPYADPIVGTRQLGLIVSMAGGPLTVTGQGRIDRWRRLWQGYGAPPLPLLLTELGEPLSGDRALRWLAHRLPHGTESTRPPVESSSVAEHRLASV